ncbi:importin-9 isoform X2 [Aplysia californica]|uniref:Importin-9 isoform X2 n=1 Tax=Aplysia californica TaxID=6500 RepID=A0ABM0JSM0_APLCA|nr:importin-9 isoform X2 [Aplysia californica]
MAGAEGDRNRSLREIIFDSLQAILSPDLLTRSGGEEQIKALEVTEEFGVYLAEITVDVQGPLAIRQLASVLLKQYVQCHWSKQSDKFISPEATDAAKAHIRQLLPQGLSESISKVRSSIAYAISAIAHWDWPELWPDLFPLLMQALTSGQPNAVHGSMRVLSEFSQDVTDTQMGHVAPIILPELYKVFIGAESFGVRTRSRAVHIFNIVAGMVSTMQEFQKGVAKQLLFPVVPQFTKAFIQCLQLPDSHTCDSGLKLEVIKALTTLIKGFPKTMAPSLPEILPSVWSIFTQSADLYVRTVVNNVEDADDPVDSDGDVLGFENLVYTVFEFVHCLIESSRYRSSVKKTVDQILYYVIVYTQITEDQIRLWSNNPDQFVEDEDDDSFSYSVRISAQDLLLSLGTEFQSVCPEALCQAVTKHLQEAEAAKSAGNQHWWKIHESCMLALGSVKDMVLQAIKAGTVQFHLPGFLQTVVLGDMNYSVSPFLTGRCLWTASRFTEAMPPELIEKMLQATVGGLHMTQPASIRISGVRAVFGFCDHLKTSGNTQLLTPYLQNVLEGLIGVATQFSVEVMGLCLETLAVVITVDEQFAATNEARIGPLSLAIFLKHAGDPFIVSLVQDIVKVMASNPSCTAAIQGRFVPTLNSILNSDSEKLSPGLVSVSVEMVTCLVRSVTVPLSDTMMSCFMPVIHALLTSDDSSTLQSGGECLRAYTSLALDQVIALKDDYDNNGMHYTVQVIFKLLDPKTSEHTATFVGRLVSTVIGKCGTQLGENLDLMLRAVLSKIQQAETLSVLQSLLMVFAHLMLSQLEAVLDFLTSVPGPTGKPALEFVLNEWCSRQHLFYGSYERKISILALCKLMQHAIAHNDLRLQDIMVQGEQVLPQGQGIRTRSKAKNAPEQWTTVPALVKIYKLIINELSNAIEETITHNDDDDEEEDGDDEGVDDDIDDDEFALKGHSISDMLNNLDYEGFAVDDDDDDDPDAKNDPNYQINTQTYLTEFLQSLSGEPCYAMFSQHHNALERQVLQAININT